MHVNENAFLEGLKFRQIGRRNSARIKRLVYLHVKSLNSLGWQNEFGINWNSRLLLSAAIA